MAWLLAAVIAIVTDTPRLNCSGAGYVLCYRSKTEIGPIRCEQSDSCLTQKCHFPSFSSYNLHMIYIIITPLHTSIFSLTTIIKHFV